MTRTTRVLALGAIVAVGLVATGCRTSPGDAKDDSKPAKKKAPQAIHFVPAPAGDVPHVVQTAMAREQAAGQRLIVYEGAPWCEPCKHFHEAVASGQLDATFPNLTLLEFDAERDGRRLIEAGYGSQYIPLFALPGKDGRAAGPKAAGGIKGDGVVPYLTKKLQTLLSQGT